MRRFAFAAILPLLVIACASQPQRTQKVSGRYAIVLAPGLPDERMQHGAPLLHQSVYDMLKWQLPLAPSVAEADAVITLKAGREPHLFEYEISRGGKVVSSSAPIPVMVIGNQLSISEQQLQQRRTESSMSQAGSANSDLILRHRLGPTQYRAHSSATQRIARAIVNDLTRL
ncbi:MAG TPA: hypothetical protein VEO54_18195 [Thermoanaerobaculia bacterium]|nr:hypothetical protein [Thermoanaerobaculia bacterium]